MVKTIRISPSGESDSTPARARADALVGTLVAGRYRFEAVIRCSATGAIYRAEHRAMRLRVVVKIIYADAPPEELSRFEREAIAGARVRHPNVAAATDSGDLDDGSRYLVIEHVAGGTLRDLIDKGRLPLARAHKIARGLGAALAAVHEQGIVHRDLEPRNVMLGGPHGDDVKLVDFGLASLDLEADPASGSAAAAPAKDRALTAVGLVIGAGPYSPPEAALGTTFLDQRSDLYSLGVIVYEMLASRRPFDAVEPAALFAAQRDGTPPAFAAELAVPPPLEAAVMRLLERDASARFASANEALDAIRAALPLPSIAPQLPVGFAPRILSSRAPAPVSPWREASDAAIAFVLRTFRGARRAAEDAVRVAGPIAKKPRRLPTWALVLLASGLPLSFTIAWLLFRPAPGAPAATTAASTVRRVDAPAESPTDESGEAASGAVVVTPATPITSAAAPSASSFEGEGAATWRDRLRDFTKAKDWARAAKPIQALAVVDPAAFRDPNIVGFIVSAAVALETTGGEDADAVFDTLAQRAGTDGLDVLFEIVRGRGGTKGSKRAADTLRNPEVAVMEPAPLRVVFELHDAPCDQKPGLYDRAVKEGDQRALTELRAMRASECDRRRQHEDPCCFAHEPLDQAIQALRARLGR